MSRKRSLIDLVEHFWNRVDTSGECWLWTGEVNNKGYGIYRVYEGSGREKLLAHRFAGLMAGLPLRSSVDVIMHSCDTPACVRPEHLTLGTQLTNMRDALAKNRMNLTGLTASTARNCKNCGVEFMGAPNERYCSAHSPRKRRSA